jgi:anion-transporting  ArsA/GET3 family ATPase
VLADRGTRIVVCCGAGGVGKTTSAAALALRAAEQGRRVVVLTIDPARRLAQSMGLTELDNTPRRVSGVDESAGGRLDAMMLDMKRTFDEIVMAHTTPAKASQILANPFYQALSSSFAGTQEYMAMEKLGQLRSEPADADTDVGSAGPGADGGPAGGGPDSAGGGPAGGAPDSAGGGLRWDLVVVDTPPSRSALDFLDAPKRLGSFLDGRFIRILLAPAKTGGRAYLRVLGAGVGMVTGVLSKVLGAQMLRDLQTFIAALDTMFGGFRERADATFALLQAPGTAFLVVAAPERDALREASYFVERLATERMPLAGLVVNRVHSVGPVGASAPASPAAGAPSGPAPSSVRRGPSAGRALAAAEDLEDSGEHALTAALLRLHAERAQLAAREERLTGRFTAAHPDVPLVAVPALPGDVHDLAGLRHIGTLLAG